MTGVNAVGNEPHHVGLSRDGQTLALGGLLSVLRGQDQVFFFDVRNPRHPKFIRSNNPPGASITDEFAPLENGGFLVTFMGGVNGAAARAPWSSTTTRWNTSRRGPSITRMTASIRMASRSTKRGT